MLRVAVLLSALGLAVAPETTTICRCTNVTSSCWPSPALWASLNATVGGRLGSGTDLARVSPVNACFAHQPGDTSAAAACQVQLTRSSTTEFWPQQYSAGSITTGFLGSP